MIFRAAGSAAGPAAMPLRTAHLQTAVIYFCLGAGYRSSTLCSLTTGPVSLKASRNTHEIRCCSLSVYVVESRWKNSTELAYIYALTDGKRQIWYYFWWVFLSTCDVLLKGAKPTSRCSGWFFFFFLVFFFFSRLLSPLLRFRHRQALLFNNMKLMFFFLPQQLLKSYAFQCEWRVWCNYMTHGLAFCYIPHASQAAFPRLEQTLWAWDLN